MAKKAPERQSEKKMVATLLDLARCRAQQYFQPSLHVDMVGEACYRYLRTKSYFHGMAPRLVSQEAEGRMPGESHDSPGNQQAAPVLSALSRPMSTYWSPGSHGCCTTCALEIFV
jgi:hypothetical protein